MTRTYRKTQPRQGLRDRELTAEILPLILRRQLRADRDRSNRLALQAFL